MRQGKHRPRGHWVRKKQQLSTQHITCTRQTQTFSLSSCCIADSGWHQTGLLCCCISVPQIKLGTLSSLKALALTVLATMQERYCCCSNEMRNGKVTLHTKITLQWTIFKTTYTHTHTCAQNYSCQYWPHMRFKTQISTLDSR